MNAITIKNLKKTYANGTQALKAIDLEVKSGDFFALLGANGAGKTTIIGILTGLVNKTSGDVNVFDYNIDTQWVQARLSMGVVPQEMNFNQFEKTQEIVVTQAGYYGIDRKQAIIDSERLLKRLDLWDKRNVASRQLSGGMKRRLMIARALINNPKLLILDEPTAGVDVELRYSMWDFLKSLNQEGMTILLTTHYLEEVEQMCKNAAMIKNGEIIKYDSVRNLMNHVGSETFVVTVDELKNLEQLKNYAPREIDSTTFEVEVNKEYHLSDVIAEITGLKMIVKDIRPKGNRMEKLFLDLLKG